MTSNSNLKQLTRNPIAVALLLQTWGAVKITGVDLSAPDAKHQTDQGKMIAEIGVAVQLIFFGLFSIIAMRFNFTSRRFKQDFEQRITASDEKYVEIDGREKKLKRNWQAILLITNLASVCILVSLCCVDGPAMYLHRDISRRFVL